MNGKDRILKTLKHEKVDRVAWVPFAGVHAGSLIGKNATEMLSNGQNLFDGLMQVHKLYQPDGMPVIFDLQVEAEILGCELHWAEFGPPSVKTHPLAETNEMLCDCLQPAADKGRLPMILDVMRKIKAEVGADTALYGLICGPVHPRLSSARQRAVHGPDPRRRICPEPDGLHDHDRPENDRSL